MLIHYNVFPRTSFFLQSFESFYKAGGGGNSWDCHLSELLYSFGDPFKKNESLVYKT